MKARYQLINKYFPLLLHVMVMIVLVALSSFVSHATKGKIVPANFFADQFITGLAINIGYFYLVYFLVSHRFLTRATKLVLLILCWLSAVMFTAWLDVNQLQHLNEQIFSKHIFYFLLVNALVKGVFSLFSILTWVFVSLLADKQRRDEIQLITLQTQMNLLTRQTNPHFLFNILNALYTKAYKAKQQDLAKDISQLSTLMHYSFTQTKKSVVLLEDEIDQIEALIALHTLRINNNVTVNFHYGPIAEGAQIPPMLLNPIIENAFKYGALNNIESTINIEINIINNRLTLNVTNRDFSEQIKASSSFKESEFGLAALNQRLTLIYNQDFSLDTQQENGAFIASLTIPCQ